MERSAAKSGVVVSCLATSSAGSLDSMRSSSNEDASPDHNERDKTSFLEHVVSVLVAPLLQPGETTESYFQRLQETYRLRNGPARKKNGMKYIGSQKETDLSCCLDVADRYDSETGKYGLDRAVSTPDLLSSRSVSDCPPTPEVPHLESLQMPNPSTAPHSSCLQSKNNGYVTQHLSRLRPREARLDTIFVREEPLSDREAEIHSRLVSRIEDLLSDRALLYHTLSKLLDTVDSQGADAHAFESTSNELEETKETFKKERLLWACEKASLESSLASVTKELECVRNTVTSERIQWEAKQTAWNVERNKLKLSLEDTRKQRDKVAQDAFSDKKDLNLKAEQLIQEKARLIRNYEEMKREKEKLAKQVPFSGRPGMDAYDREESQREKFMMTARLSQMQMEIEMRAREHKNLRMTLRKVQTENDRFRKDYSALDGERKSLEEELAKARQQRPPRLCPKCAAPSATSSSSSDSSDEEEHKPAVVVGSANPKKPVNSNMVEDLKEEKKSSRRERALHKKFSSPKLEVVLEGADFVKEAQLGELSPLTI
mmetsp:Transcript_22638/g.37328  ORF Transcript_22638/g.37328 Transcript_22638/m.37328 type:complete len:544 (+) Transcript_22638:31-1662(+)